MQAKNFENRLLHDFCSLRGDRPLRTVWQRPGVALRRRTACGRQPKGWFHPPYIEPHYPSSSRSSTVSRWSNSQPFSHWPVGCGVEWRTRSVRLRGPRRPLTRMVLERSSWHDVRSPMPCTEMSTASATAASLSQARRRGPMVVAGTRCTRRRSGVLAPSMGVNYGEISATAR